MESNRDEYSAKKCSFSDLCNKSPIFHTADYRNYVKELFISRTIFPSLFSILECIIALFFLNTNFGSKLFQTISRIIQGVVLGCIEGIIVCLLIFFVLSKISLIFDEIVAGGIVLGLAAGVTALIFFTDLWILPLGIICAVVAFIPAFFVGVFICDIILKDVFDFDLETVGIVVSVLGGLATAVIMFIAYYNESSASKWLPNILKLLTITAIFFYFFILTVCCLQKHFSL